MKFKLTAQHFDMKPGMIVYSAGMSTVDKDSMLVTEVENDKTEGALRIVPTNKLEKCDA